MARTKDKAPLRKREILEHFQQVLVEEGFEGASIGRIARRMGINPSLIIHYFSTKEDMIVELVDFILEKYESTFLKRLEVIDDPEERLKTGLGTIFSVDWISLVDTRAFNSCYYLSLRNPKVKVRFQKMYQHFRDYLVQEITLYMDKGIIPATDPAKDADLIIAIVEGLSFYRNISGGRKKYGELGAYLKQRILTILNHE
ncbi:MAG TPA: TetR/AcrR family transcriptional regulator [Deltaproteobacteria bacterium]|nr:TetR/AcrR family transcriptional regulator [Deltaproteobacteria bacterium]